MAQNGLFLCFKCIKFNISWGSLECSSRLLVVKKEGLRRGKGKERVRKRGKGGIGEKRERSGGGHGRDGAHGRRQPPCALCPASRLLPQS